MKKDGWREFLSKRYAGQKSDSPIEALYTATFYVMRRHLNVPDEPVVLVQQQVEIGHYRADVVFVCKTAEGQHKRLVVELDGHEFHERTKEQAAKDRARDRWMLEQGLTVIRFTGSEVWNDPFSCCHQTAEHIFTLIHGMSRAQSVAAAGLAAIHALFEREA